MVDVGDRPRADHELGPPLEDRLDELQENLGEGPGPLHATSSGKVVLDGVYIHERALFDRLLHAQERMSAAILNLLDGRR